MKKQKSLWIIITMGILLMVILLVSQVMLRDRSTITLPAPPAESDAGEGNNGADTLNVLRITPETVQAAVATLSRPAS